ncbi:(2Fe-2S)-binding protein [Zoogloea sp.]|uniref:(2Fe-2S)-binding protein n=1 Tax=Zoogloea sp. TaxID=49181 RepID=UPI002630399E|nr:(2Fe-2S)-binding protein [Zoogloea sp.]MDD3354152.1 (2Fe-2S)-binding protein [Zoogloea sp.]
MYVCVCRAVTEKHIETAVKAGARRLRDLRVQLGVTEECGRCAKCAKQCLEGAVDQASTSAPRPRHYPLIQEAA